MKIVVVEPAGKGGLLHYAFQLCRAMQELGADVTLITHEGHELESLPHRFHIEPSFRLWDPKPAGTSPGGRFAAIGRKLRRVARGFVHYREWWRFTRAVRRLDPDVVQLSDIRFPLDLLPLLRLRKRARVLADICHNVRPFAGGGSARGSFDRSRWSEWFYRRIYRQFDFVFVHFERNRIEFLSTFDLDPRRVEPIVHGNETIFDELADPDLDPLRLRERHGIGPDEPVVLFFGTLSRYKGIDVLLESFPAIREASGARLVLAGYPLAGFDLDAHQKRARALGMDDAVTWIPHYVPNEEVKAWMQLAGVLVLPYRAIYQSGALQTALTFGVPIVASSVGGMEDVLAHEKTGLLVRPEDPDALAQAVTRLLEDRQLARSLGDAARADAMERFSWTAVARIILDRYEDLERPA